MKYTKKKKNNKKLKKGIQIKYLKIEFTKG